MPVAFSNGDGTFTVTNSNVSNFPGYAVQAGAKAVSGDFNNNGKHDVALTGGIGWNTIPVAFSNANGTFTVTNTVVSNFPGWAATQGAKPVVGDINNDGRADIALTGASGWNTIPVAFSNGDGSFNVTTSGISNFPGWAAQSNMKAVPGDFNHDFKADIALTGGINWNTIPVAFSNGDGNFNVMNLGVTSGYTSFTLDAQTAGVMPVAGDFDNDGKADIALVGGSGWTTIRIAYSNGDGTFRGTNGGVTSGFTDFPTYAAHPGARVVSGDFDGDGKSDIALVGQSSWSTIPVAYSNGDGTFHATNSASVGSFPVFAAQTGANPADKLVTPLNVWGTWTRGIDAPFEPIHAALLRNDKIIAAGGSQYNCSYTWGTQSTYVYDVTPGIQGSWTSVSSPYGPDGGAEHHHDAFCSGHAHDRYGRVIFEGGLLGYGNENGSGETDSARYDPSTNQWTALTGGPQRWYPTLVGDDSFAGNVYMFSGNYGGNDGSIWRLQTDTTQWVNTGLSVQTMFTYPRVLLLPDTRFFVASPAAGTRYNYYVGSTVTAASTSDPATQVPLDSLPGGGSSNVYDSFLGTAVLMPLDSQSASSGAQVLLVDGYTPYLKVVTGLNLDLHWNAAGTRPTVSGLAQGATHALPAVRYYGAGVLIPTGQVVVLGGVSNTADDATAVRDVEIFGDDYFPGTANKWSWTNAAAMPRNYHNVALLLRDGRIWTASTNRNSAGSYCGDNTDNRELRVEIFSPWYVRRSDRPVITSCPTSLVIGGGNTYTIGVGNSEGNNIAFVNLMRAGSMTHTFDTDQRLIHLDIVSTTSSSVNFNMPNEAEAPPGDYMLFILKRETPCGQTCPATRLIPSVGCWTRTL